jgi:hypothetical protein
VATRLSAKDKPGGRDHRTMDGIALRRISRAEKTPVALEKRV